MEGAENSKRGFNRNRNSNSHISISDTESATSQVDSWHSPLRSDSPLRAADDSGEKNSMALVLVDNKYHSPVPSPGNSNVPATGGNSRRPNFPANGVLGVNKMVREEAAEGVKKVGLVEGGLEEGYGGEAVGGERRSRAAVSSILKRSERNVAVKRVALAFRVFEVIACLVSFSVMAADKTEGWSGDSFDRYIEYRYSLAVNVIGFVYSAFQAFDLGYFLGTDKHVFSHHLRHHFDFAMDQILAYLLMSASSSAATRVDDWISNWGADKFTLMASASIAMSFLAFLAFAFSSLISGYNLCNRDSA